MEKIITQTDKHDNKWVIDASIDIDRIEHNQKIVDIVQKWYEQVLDDLSMIVEQGGKDYDMLNLQNKLRVILEGKDIKDLSTNR